MLKLSKGYQHVGFSCSFFGLCTVHVLSQFYQRASVFSLTFHYPITMNLMNDPKVTISSASQLSKATEFPVTGIALALLYISGLSILLCIGPSPWEWLFLDVIVLTAVYLQHRADPVFWRQIMPNKWWFHLALSLGTVSTCIAFSMLTAAPSHAFFAGAQTFLETCFADSRQAIVIFFSILRLLLIAYIGAQLIFAVFQISRGESPLPLLLPALAVVIAITIGSVFTELVLNGTTCT